MKKITLFLIVLMASVLMSCKPSVVLDQEDRTEMTTVAMQRAAEADSTMYHVLFEDNTLYVLDSDLIVVAKAYADSTLRKATSTSMYLVIGFILGIFMTAIFPRLFTHKK